MEFQQHSLYEQSLSDWRFWSQSYTGGSDYLTKSNIFRHSREADDHDYERRIAQAVYPNYCRPIIDTYSSFVFGSEQPVNRDSGESGDLELFWEDATLSGETISDFMANVSILAQVYGHVGVIIDMPQTDTIILSRADEIARNIRPYATVYTPDRVPNWAVDRFHRLLWVQVKETIRDDADPEAAGFEEMNLIRTWTRNEWMLHDEDGALLERGEHGLGVVPFVPFYFHRRPDVKQLGISQLQDIARINRMLANLFSYINEFSSKQAFPFLAGPMDTVSNGEAGMTISEQNIYEVGENMPYPAYVSPPTDPAQFMQMFAQDTLVKEMYRAAKLEHRILQEQSGVAKQMDFHETNHALMRFARHLEQGEQRMTEMVNRWLGVENEGAVVDYPDTFNLESMSDALENALKVDSLYTERSDTFISEHLKRIARRLEPKLSQDVQEVIAGELDEAAAAESQADAFAGELNRLRQAA